MEGGLFQAFYMLFKANGDEAEKELGGIEQAAKKTEGAAEQATEAFEKLGKKGGDGAKKATDNVKKLKTEMVSAETVSRKLSSSFMDFAKGLAAPLLGAVSIGGLVSIAKTRAAEIDALSKGAAKINMPVGEFEAFGRSARDMGGDVKAAEADLQNLYKRIGEASINPKSDPAKQFAALGVKLKGTKGEAKSTKEVLLDLSRTVEKLDPTKATAGLRKLGINDQGTIDLLLKGRKAVEEMMGAHIKNGVVTEEQARIVGDFNEEMDRFGDTMKGVGNTIAEYILPIITNLTRAFRTAYQWLGDNKTLVQGFFVGVAGVITAVYMPAVLSAVAATIALVAPYLLLAGLVAGVGAAFALAWEDVSMFLNGQPSLLGDLVAKYEWVAKTVKGIGEAIQWVGRVGSAIGSELGEVWANQARMNEQSKQDIIDAWNYLQPFLSKLGKAIGDDLAGVWNTVSQVFGLMVEDIKSAGSSLKAGWDELVVWAKEAWDRIVNSFKEAGPALKAEFVVLKDGLTQIMGEITAAIETGFKTAIDYVKGLWDGLVSYIMGKLASLKASILGWWNGTASSVGGGDPVNAWQTGVSGGQVVAPGPRNPEIMRRAQERNAEATAAPFGAQTGAQAAGPTNNNITQDIDKSTHLTTGPITVQTQATDANGIAASMIGAMEDHFRQTTTSIDDGIDR